MQGKPKTQQQRGGIARAERLSPEDRKAIAREAALSRWGDTLPRAIKSGLLTINRVSLSCAVLDNDVRILTQSTFLEAMGRSKSPRGGTGIADGMPPFLAAENLWPYLDKETLQYVAPVKYRTEAGFVALGYDAQLLPRVCLAYMDARDDDALRASQQHIARRASLLFRGLANVGIVALVDEATGFQELRARDELVKILEHYIAPELRPWTKVFPDEFFEQMYRLQGWPYKPGVAKRTQFVGHLINRLIYGQLPPRVLDELRERNPTLNDRGYRRYKHHQFLSEHTGIPHLDRQIAIVMTLMRISDDKDEFTELFARASDLHSQRRLPFVVKVEAPEPAG
jgi:hypothetical protein